MILCLTWQMAWHWTGQNKLVTWLSQSYSCVWECSQCTDVHSSQVSIRTAAL